MVILSFTSFIVLISALGRGGVLYLIWSQSIVLGVINPWEVLRLTSQLLPPSTFLYRTRSSFSSSVSTNNTTATTKTTKENKRWGGITVDGAISHGLSFFYNHKAQMAAGWGPWTCRSSRMSAPLVSVVVGSCHFLHPRPKRWRVRPNPWHLGSALEKAVPYYMATIPCLMELKSAFICIKPNKLHQSAFTANHFVGNCMMSTFVSTKPH